jgi:hypothetical protein
MPRRPGAPRETRVCASRPARPAPEGALWLDEPLAPVDATVAAAVRDAALMLAEAGAIVDESARPAFSFEEAWEVFAVFTHALIGAALPATNWPPRARFLDRRSLPSRSASARDAPEHTGFHRHSGAAGAASPGVRVVFRAHRRGALPARPHGTHPARSKAQSACAIDRGQWQSKALFRPDAAVSLSRHWRRLAGRRGSGDAWRRWHAARRPNHRLELRGPRGHRLRRDARSTRRKF